MSDATLPPPRSSSVGPISEVRERSNSSQSREEFDVSGEQSSDPATGEGGSGESESRTENKQRRKRTRYAFILLFHTPLPLLIGAIAVHGLVSLLTFLF